MTLLPELRVAMPAVGAIQLVWRHHQESTQTTSYTHCDGKQTKLNDSDLGQEHYHCSDYYVWSAGNDGQLLFIFPTRVSLTNITLHYYSDSVQGCPRLRFHAVPDDFDVWDALIIGNPQADVASVPPGGEPAGRRSVSINVNFKNKKVLMYKFHSSFQLAVSEVEFFTCSSKHIHNFMYNKIIITGAPLSSSPPTQGVLLLVH